MFDLLNPNGYSRTIPNAFLQNTIFSNAVTYGFVDRQGLFYRCTHTSFVINQRLENRTARDSFYITQTVPVILPILL